MSEESWWIFLDGVFVAGVFYVAVLFALIFADKRKKPAIKTINGDEALRLWLNQLKADAWEEGYAHGDADAFTEARLNRDNPYGQAERLAAFEKATPEDYTQGEEDV